MLFFFNFSFFPPSFFSLISFFVFFFSSIIFYTMFHSQGNGASFFFFSLIPSTSSEVSQVWHECLGRILQAHVSNPVVVTMPTKWSGKLVFFFFLKRPWKIKQLYNILVGEALSRVIACPKTFQSRDSQKMVQDKWHQHAAPGNLLKKQILGSHSRPVELETLELEPRNLCFNKPSRLF